MKQDNKKCWSCESFHAYYTRGYCRLMKENNGLCGKYNKIMQKSESCDQWHCRRKSREKRITIAINSIPEIYNKVAILEQLLKEEFALEAVKQDIDSVNQ